MAALHPLLDRMMIENGYGRVMSRTGELSMRMRELCVVAALSGQNVAPQLTSHIRGAMRCGASEEEVIRVTPVVACDLVPCRRSTCALCLLTFGTH